MFSAPHHSCSGPGNVAPHEEAGCCVTDTRCVPAVLSCLPLPAEPADATGSPVWQWPPTGKEKTDKDTSRCDFTHLLFTERQRAARQYLPSVVEDGDEEHGHEEDGDPFPPDVVRPVQGSTETGGI